jgi:hypothetical protein
MITVQQLQTRIAELKALDGLLEKFELKKRGGPSSKAIVATSCGVFTVGLITAFSMAAYFYNKIDDPDSSTVSQDPNEQKRQLAAVLGWMCVGGMVLTCLGGACVTSVSIKKLYGLSREDLQALIDIMKILQKDKLLNNTIFANPDASNIKQCSVAAFREILGQVIRKYETALADQTSTAASKSKQKKAVELNNSETLPELKSLSRQFRTAEGLRAPLLSDAERGTAGQQNQNGGQGTMELPKYVPMVPDWAK